MYLRMYTHIICVCSSELHMYVHMQINGADSDKDINEIMQSDEGGLLADVLQRCGITQTIKVCVYVAKRLLSTY